MNAGEERTVNWREIEARFIRMLLGDGYSQKAAEELGFIISQTLEDAYPLICKVLDDSQIDSTETEEIFELLHVFFNNAMLVEKGSKLLMRATR